MPFKKSKKSGKPKFYREKGWKDAGEAVIVPQYSAHFVLPTLSYQPVVAPQYYLHVLSAPFAPVVVSQVPGYFVSCPTCGALPPPYR